jgi:hypothetical protein
LPSKAFMGWGFMVLQDEEKKIVSTHNIYHRYRKKMVLRRASVLRIPFTHVRGVGVVSSGVISLLKEI